MGVSAAPRVDDFTASCSLFIYVKKNDLTSKESDLVNILVIPQSFSKWIKHLFTLSFPGVILRKVNLWNWLKSIYLT